MAITRLTDRLMMDDNNNVVKDKNGKEVWIRRFGLWGTTAEIEIVGRKIEVVLANGTRTRFETKTKAEEYLKSLL